MVGEVLGWKVQRRPPLEAEEIASAVRGRGLLNWIDVDPSEDLLPDTELELVG